jgi:hypothetical protein
MCDNYDKILGNGYQKLIKQNSMAIEYSFVASINLKTRNSN